jgi:hypothetical protein
LAAAAKLGSKASNSVRSITTASPGLVPAKVKIAGRQIGVRLISDTASPKLSQVSKTSLSRWLGGIAVERFTLIRALTQPAILPNCCNFSGGWLIAAANRPSAMPVKTPASPGQATFR